MTIFLPFRSVTDKLQLTHEQVRIIKHDVKSGEIVKIVAFAGTITRMYTSIYLRLADTIDILTHYIVIVPKYLLVYFKEEVHM